jgi:hypothetical protein
MFSPGFGMKALAVTGGAVGAHVVGNWIHSMMPENIKNQGWVKPVSKVGAGVLIKTVGQMSGLLKKNTADLILLGSAVAALMDVYTMMSDQDWFPAALKGYGDYVQMPYSGYGTPAQVAAGEFGDYVQLPYSGYGTPAQVAAGEFGHYNAGEMATFGPTF